MAITTFGTGAAGIVSIGANTTGTAWGGLSGGFRVACNGGNFTQYDVLFTGATVVTLGAYFASGASDCFATLLDSTGVTTINTTTPVLTTGSFVDVPAPLFASLTAGTTYWLRLTFVGGGNDLLCSANFIQLTTATTATISTPPGYGTVYTFGSLWGGTDISANVGLEGGLRNIYPTVSNWQGVLNTLVTSGRVVRQGLLRFKGTFSALYIYQYQSGHNWQLNQLPLNGSSGVPLHSYSFATPGSGGNTAGWQLISNALDNSQEYLWELTASAQTSNFILMGIMTSGGTGIDMGVTGSTLVRSLLAVVEGDSIEAGDNGTNNYPVNNSQWSLFQQNQNKQILNIAIPGATLQTLSGGSLYQDANALGVPQFYCVGAGINDIKVGSPPTPTTLTGYMNTLVKNLRTLSGWSAVPIYEQAIDNYNGLTFAAIGAYNSGANGFNVASVQAFNAGTISGQSPSPDPNVFYIPRDTWGRGNGNAGGTYTTGGSFVGFYYDADGLHPNSVTALGNPSSTTALSGYYFLYSHLLSIFVPSSGPIGFPDMAGGMQSLNGGING